MVMYWESSMQDFLYIFTLENGSYLIVKQKFMRKENIFRGIMTEGHRRQDAWIKVFGGLLQGNILS